MPGEVGHVAENSEVEMEQRTRRRREMASVFYVPQLTFPSVERTDPCHDVLGESFSPYVCSHPDEQIGLALSYNDHVALIAVLALLMYNPPGVSQSEQCVSYTISSYSL